jgi:hypothetical protein
MAEDDLIVEHCAPDKSSSLESWCVSRRGVVIFVDARLDFAVDAARRRAAALGCAAWLISGGSEPIKIDSATHL